MNFPANVYLVEKSWTRHTLSRAHPFAPALARLSLVAMGSACDFLLCFGFQQFGFDFGRNNCQCKLRRKFLPKFERQPLFRYLQIQVQSGAAAVAAALVHKTDYVH